MLAVPGNSTIGGMLGDVVGHFFSAALLAVVPIVGYRLLYKHISEKEMTYIFATWVAQAIWAVRQEPLTGIFSQFDCNRDVEAITESVIWI